MPVSSSSVKALSRAQQRRLHLSRSLLQSEQFLLQSRRGLQLHGKRLVSKILNPQLKIARATVLAKAVSVISSINPNEDIKNIFRPYLSITCP